MRCLTVCLIGLVMGSLPALAQNDLRQPNGPVDLRVDGRPNKREGLSPSAADKSITDQKNDVRRQICAGAAQLNALERPGLSSPPPQLCN